jgi:hypothetical protein
MHNLKYCHTKSTTYSQPRLLSNKYSQVHIYIYINCQTKSTTYLQPRLLSNKQSQVHIYNLVYCQTKSTTYLQPRLLSNKQGQVHIYNLVYCQTNRAMCTCTASPEHQMEVEFPLLYEVRPVSPGGRVGEVYDGHGEAVR